MFKVYTIESKNAYTGISLVAACDATEANEIIQEFRDTDRENIMNSYGYSNVDESDVVQDVYARRKGIMLYGISYTGSL